MVLVSVAEVFCRACDMLKQMLDVLVILTSFQARLVVDHQLNLRGVFAVLLAFRLIDVNDIENTFINFERKFLACLD